MFIVDVLQMQMPLIVFKVTTWFIFFTYDTLFLHVYFMFYFIEIVECNTVLPQNFPIYFPGSSLDMYKLHKATPMPFL